jgi:hypothetical protein
VPTSFAAELVAIYAHLCEFGAVLTQPIHRKKPGIFFSSDHPARIEQHHTRELKRAGRTRASPRKPILRNDLTNPDHAICRHNLLLVSEHLAAARVHQHLQPIEIIGAVPLVISKRLDAGKVFYPLSHRIERKDLSIRK